MLNFTHTLPLKDTWQKIIKSSVIIRLGEDPVPFYSISQYTKYMKKLKPIPMAEYQKMIKHFIILMLIVRS